MGALLNLWQFIKHYRDVLIVVLTPILLLPIVFVYDGQEALCGYTMVLVGVYWITEAFPIPVTSLIPVILFPLFGIMPVAEITPLFMKSLALRIIGAIGVAIALEESRVHERIALRVLLTLGSSPARLMLGLMLTSFCLSMFMSNTASAVMVLSVAYALIDELVEIKKRTKKADLHGITNTGATLELEIEEEQANHTESKCVSDPEKANISEENTDSKPEDDELDKETLTFIDNLNTTFSLSVLFGVICGGPASLTGMSINVVTLGYLDEMYHELGRQNPVTFTSWLGFGVPNSLIIMTCGWIWLQIYCFKSQALCFGKKDTVNEKLITEILREQYKRLGSIRFAEVSSIMHLVVLVVLWITADLSGNGWYKFFEPKYIKDAVPASLILVSLFIFPSELPNMTAIKSGKPPKSKPLLSWKAFKNKVPWGLIFLIGGGFALAEGTQRSGLSDVIAAQLDPLLNFHPIALNFLLCLFIASVTEFMSISSTVALLLPIVQQMSLKLGREPWFLIFSSHIAACFCFMLPSSTISTATIFSYGRLRMSDMIRVGFMMNILAVTVLVLNNQWLGKALYDGK